VDSIQFFLSAEAPPSVMMSSTPAPRCVLISDEPLNHVSGSGVTMHSLFGAVPAADRFQVWDHPVLGPQADLAAHFFRQSAPPRPRTEELSGELKSALEAFSPEVIYCAAVSPHLLQLAWEVQRDFNCPLILHVMDDWPHWDTQHPHPSATCLLKNSWFERLCGAASRRVAISPLMAAEYESQTGFSWEVFHHSVDLEHYPFPASHPPANGRRFRIGYVGSLRQMFHGDCFEDLLEMLGDGRLPQADLTIHTHPHWAVEYQRAFGACPSIHFAAPVSQGDLPAALTGFDVLFLPLTFNPENNAITRLSLPTKLGEYVAARRPIVIYGPPDTASHRLLESWPLAFVQTERGKAGLAVTLKKAFESLTDQRTPKSLASHPVLAPFDRKKTVEAWTRLLASEAPPQSPHSTPAPILPSGYLPAESTWTVPAGINPTRLEIELCQTKAQVALVFQKGRTQKIPAAGPGCFSFPVEDSRLKITCAPAWKPRDLGLPGFEDAAPLAGYVRSWRWT
jgi:hypothetical protein